MMEVEKPRAKSNMKCPLWKKPMKQVCHTCPWWKLIRGKHPQSEETFDQWGCAIEWLPVLLVENSQMQMQTAAAVDKVATEVNNANEQQTALRAELVGSVVRTMITASRAPNREQVTDGRDYPRS
jgi:hypothetical protein